MPSIKPLWKRKVESSGQDLTVVADDQKFANVNKVMGEWMFWVAGLSILFLMVHYLRWAING